MLLKLLVISSVIAISCAKALPADLQGPKKIKTSELKRNFNGKYYFRFSVDPSSWTIL